MKARTILVTGGAGFIGSAVVRHLIGATRAEVVNLDKLTYAGHLESLGEARDSSRHHFEEADVADRPAVERVFARYRPDAVIHLAAETHVDRSIDGPSEFVRTNVQGTFTLLEAARRYWDTLEGQKWEEFRFLCVSTDEVFGSLGEEGRFREDSRYDPRSPYSASKASADHFAKAYHHTFDLPVIVTNCSNNYGPYQFPEKLIPLATLRAAAGEPIPVYGRGENVRDWLHVDDHVAGLMAVLEGGRPGETYNIGGDSERTNLQLVKTICEALDELVPSERPYHELITFVEDRPGHDLRYAIDAGKIRNELGWAPKRTFEAALRETVAWYLENRDWCETVTRGAKYRLERLGRLDQE
ncbi:MAG TPA: dTDP-glucose 4,6-dehydratase [Trueperaceae bacterium]